MERSKLIDSLKSVFEVNLGAKPGEEVLIFTDIVPPGAEVGALERSRREGLIRVARAASEAARSLGVSVRYLEYPALGSHGSEPGPELWRLAYGEAAASALEAEGLIASIMGKRVAPEQLSRAAEIVREHGSEAVDAVVALSNYSTSHTRFRDLLTSAANARYASMPLFEEDMLEGSMTADWTEVARKAEAIMAAMEGATEVIVTTPAGTHITLGVTGRKALPDTGMLTEPGSFSNLPAGEVYVAPLEGTAYGTLVIEWAPDHRLETPLTVKVADGMVADVAGDGPYRDRLINGLDARAENRNIAELGIGINDRATRPDNILESEKILGTIHIAFGDNSSMGGRVSTPFHQDFVYFNPTVVVAGGSGKITLIDNGKLTV